MKDFLNFNKMITPTIIQIFFWMASAIFVLIGIVMLSQSYLPEEKLMGIGFIVLGPIVVRIYCELTMLFFKMFESLQGIKKQLDKPDSDV